MVRMQRGRPGPLMRERVSWTSKLEASPFIKSHVRVRCKAASRHNTFRKVKEGSASCCFRNSEGEKKNGKTRIKEWKVRKTTHKSNAHPSGSRIHRGITTPTLAKIIFQNKKVVYIRTP
eukprot:RCo047743